MTPDETLSVAEPEVATTPAPAEILVAPAPAAIPLPDARTLAGAAAIVMTVAAAAGYSAISLYRYVHFGANGFDLGIQDQTVWGYSRLEMIPNTVEGMPNLLGDHFNPILMVLAPFYWVWPSAATLLIAQAVLLAIAGIPVYLWGAQKVGHAAGLAFLATYLLFWGVLAGVVFDFHHVVFAVPAISTALYATLNKQNRLLWAAVAVAMLTREDVTLTVIALGLYIAVFQRRWLLGAVMAVANAAWFLLLLQVVMPAVGGAPYGHWTFQALGKGPLSAALYVVTHPITALQMLFSPVEKLRVGVASFANWMFLPLLSPLVLIAVPSFLERFWSSSPTFWSFHYQYSMLPAPILTFAAIDTCARMRAWWKGRLGLAASISLPLGALAASVLLSVGLVHPLAELGTYVSDSTAAQIQGCLDVIPAGASVAATDALVPHLSDRSQIYEVTTRSDMDYVAIDVTTLGTANPVDDKLRAIINSSLAGGYGVACSNGLTVVLKRGGGSQQLSPEMQAWLADSCTGSACATLTRG
ncbi:MAG TPA: DUF2079 domain-containing protein [Candidatus Dormibacteraeota bacterium]|nr:DUF2079 domain-containing protein [Candidatus Dormibacteraeota bacterium]